MLECFINLFRFLFSCLNPQLSQTEIQQKNMHSKQPCFYLYFVLEQPNNPKEQILKQIKLEPKVLSPRTNYTKGLSNIGNTCYMNSVLQCLHKSKHFTARFAQKPNLVQFPKAAKLSNLFGQFLRQMNERNLEVECLSIINQEVQCLGDIKQIIGQKNYIFAQFNQNDVMQFLSTFLSTISQELSKCNQQKYKEIDHYGDPQDILRLTIENDERLSKSIIEQTFTGRYKVSYTCLEQQCGKAYVMFEKFNVHYINIPKISQIQSHPKCQLQDCLKQFQLPEILKDDNKLTCGKCQKETESAKMMQIHQPNKILIMVLKRFKEGKKDKTHVRIPQRLTPDVLMNTKNQKYEGKVYRLYAVILHLGTLNGGHYSAVCLVPSTNMWIEYSDQSVGQPKTFNEVDFRNAYAVFYQLQQNVNIEQSKTISLVQNKSIIRIKSQEEDEIKRKGQNSALIINVITILAKGANGFANLSQIPQNSRIQQEVEQSKILSDSLKAIYLKILQANPQNKVQQLLNSILQELNKQPQIYKKFIPLQPATIPYQRQQLDQKDSLSQRIVKFIREYNSPENVQAANLIIIDVRKLFDPVKRICQGKYLPTEFKVTASKHNQSRQGFIYKLFGVIQSHPGRPQQIKLLDAKESWYEQSLTTRRQIKQFKFLDPQYLFYQRIEKVQTLA